MALCLWQEDRTEPTAHAAVGDTYGHLQQPLCEVGRRPRSLDKDLTIADHPVSELRKPSLSPTVHPFS